MNLSMKNENMNSINVLRRRMPHRGWIVTSTDSVKVIRLKSWQSVLDDPHIWENLKGSRIHV